MVPAVPNSVVLEDELCGNRCAETQREGRCAIEFFVGKRADRFGCLTAIAAQEVEHGSFRNLLMITGVRRVQLGDDLPRDIAYCRPASDSARQVELDRVDEGDVMNDLTHSPVVCRRGGSFPLRVRESFGKRGQFGRTFLDASGKRFGAATH